MSSNPSVQQGFPRFKHLPTELQLMIWEFALCNRRSIIELNVYTDKILPRYPPPAVFHTNRQSRGVAIKKFKRLLFNLSPTRETGIYIDHSTDTLHLRPHYQPPSPQAAGTEVFHHLANSLPDDERAKIRHLAVSPVYIHFLHDQMAFSEEISQFPELETFVLVRQDRPPYYYPSDAMMIGVEVLMAYLEEILAGTKALYPDWQKPDVEVVFWDGM